MSIFVIGDVHGNLKTLQALLSQLPQGARKVLCGDLIDRGPKSRQVVDFVIQEGFDCVRGNHEELMVAWDWDLSFHNIWLRNGGVATLDSYVNDDTGEIDPTPFEAHRKWMSELPLFLEYPEIRGEDGRSLLVSHSSCSSVWHWSEKRRVENAELFKQHILWGRLPHGDIPNVYNVFGHTIQDNGPKIKTTYANIDTGCYWESPKNNRLTALQFPEMLVFSQENVDREIPVNLGDG